MRSLQELEALEQKLFRCFVWMPNSPERQDMYKKWKVVYDEITLREGKSK